MPLTWVLFPVYLLGSALLLFMAIFLFLDRFNISSIKSPPRGESRGNFFVYLSIVFLLELILSTVLTSAYPGLVSSLNVIQSYPETLYVPFLFFQWFYVELIIMEAIPALAVALIARRLFPSLKLGNVISPGVTDPRSLASLTLFSTLCSAIFSVYFLLGSPDFVPNMISLAFTSFLLIAIYFRFGLKEFFLASFSFNTLSAIYTVTSTDTSTLNGYISTSVFLVILLFSFMGLAGSLLKITQISESRTRKVATDNKPPRSISLDPKDLWIRSSCPSCGSATFKVENDLSMTCSNCSGKVDRDYAGPMNIKIEFQKRPR